MRFAIVGTNWISARFIEAGKMIDGFNVTAVYSRKQETADAFADHHHIEHRFSDWLEFLQSDTYDAVYIATPNVYHDLQSIDVMNYGKHVLCEKPLTISATKAAHLFEVAEFNEVMLMEAMKSIHSAAFKKIEDWIKDIGTIRRVNFHYDQYSSRYDKYKEGVILNAFKPELGNGALMDLGVYTVAPVVALFGVPEQVQSTSEKLSTGADGQGTALLSYPDMTAVLSYSKIADGHLPSEIIGEEGIISVDAIGSPSVVKKMKRDGEVIETFEHDAPAMSYEIATFMNMIDSKEAETLQKYQQITMDTMTVVDEIKKQNQLGFK